LTVVLVVRRLVVSSGMRRGDQQVIDQKRRRNKLVANRLVRALGRAGRRGSPFAVIGSIGRRTGRTFETPVRVVREDPTAVCVPLTYGRSTDWLRNVRLNDGYLVWQGRRIRIGRPEIVPLARTPLDLPLPSRLLLWLDGTGELVQLEKLTHTGIT